MFGTVDELKKAAKDGKIYFEYELASDVILENNYEELGEIIINEQFSFFSSEVEDGSLYFDVGYIDLLYVNRESDTVTIKVTVYVTFY